MQTPGGNHTHAPEVTVPAEVICSEQVPPDAAKQRARRSCVHNPLPVATVVLDGPDEAKTKRGAAAKRGET